MPASIRSNASEASTVDSDTEPYTNGNRLHNGIKNLSVRPTSMDRRNSSPMMPAFMTSAPGKVIVFGEHSVVHGKAAMAASISLRSYLLVTALSKSRRTITLRFPDVGLDHTWRISELPWSTFQAPGKKRSYYDLVTELDKDLVQSLQPHLEKISPNSPEAQRKVHQNAASGFLYLFLSLGTQNFPGCVYTLRSTIPIGAGLGSSASIAVCVSSALLKQLHALSGPHPDQPAEEAALQIERINRWAFVFEMILHGNPSGVDNTVAAGGRAVIFKREDYNRPPNVRSIRDFPEFKLLLVDTKQPKSTAAEVAKVGSLKKSQPAVANCILDAMDKVTESAVSIVSGEDFDEDELDCVRPLGQLFELNHGLLASLGVSHPKLERVRELVTDSGLGWTKLTGAGGGGCAITLLKPGHSRADVTELERKLTHEGFEVFDTVLGGDGVGILWPAVLHNGTDEEGGEEIDEENFLKAEGALILDKLVGVGVREKREDWKYWR